MRTLTDRDTVDIADIQRAPLLMPGARIGRYVVLHDVGHGAMGVVYAAWDPKLDRKIAVKLLHAVHGSAGSLGATRLIREARALAKLSHPNVVAVHDADVHDGNVFVAMEFIEGDSLTRWLRAARAQGGRPWRDVVDVFVQAGRGLAAAHAAAIVHRDFKPDNVLVGRDGRVCVADFGIAAAPGAGGDRRERNAETEPAPEPTPSGEPEAVEQTTEIVTDDRMWSDGGNRLTRTGAVMGTPAYMSPEQHLNNPIDARADQFSFCVSLYEALFRQPPFAGEDLPSLWVSVTTGRVREPPRNSPVPAWVRRVVLRGLAQRPKNRYPSIDALLVDLSGTSERRRRLRRAVLMVGGAACVGLWSAYALWPTAPDPCASPERHLEGVWDDSRRDGAREAFAATELPFADQSWSSAEEALDHYAQQWTAMRREACEATHVHHEQSADLLDRRNACLDGKLRRLNAQVELFMRADRDVVSGAVGAIDALPDLADCADTERLLGAEPEPTGARKQAMDAADASLAQAIALHEVGKLEEAALAAERALQEAQAAEAPALEAAAHHARALIARERMSWFEAEAEFLDALEAAERASSAIERRRAQEALAFLLAFDLRQPRDAERWLRAAEATARAASEVELADLDTTASVVLSALGRHTEAVARAERAVTRHRAARGDESLPVARAIDLLATILSTAGDAEGALARYREAHLIREARLGPHHPLVSTSLNNIGAELTVLSRLDEARQVYDRALSIRRATFGDDHPQVAAMLMNIANLETALGRLEPAIERYREALASLERSLGERHPNVAATLFNFAICLQAANRHAEAVDAYRRALSIRESALAPDDPDLASTRLGLGVALLELGRGAQAVELLEHALPILEQAPGKRLDFAEAQWMLARALPSDRRRDALALAHAAAQDYERAGNSALARTIETWAEKRE